MANNFQFFQLHDLSLDHNKIIQNRIIDNCCEAIESMTPFNGKPESFLAFKNEVIQIVSNFPEVSDQTILLGLDEILIDKAKVYTPLVCKFQTVNQLLAYFSIRFGITPHHAAEILHKISICEQNSDETVLNFYTRLQNLYYEIYSLYESASDSIDALVCEWYQQEAISKIFEQFLHGLKYPLNHLVQHWNPHSLQEAVKLASFFESQINHAWKKFCKFCGSRNHLDDFCINKTFNIIHCKYCDKSDHIFVNCEKLATLTLKFFSSHAWHTEQFQLNQQNLIGKIYNRNFENNNQDISSTQLNSSTQNSVETTFNMNLTEFASIDENKNHLSQLKTNTSNTSGNRHIDLRPKTSELPDVVHRSNQYDNDNQQKQIINEKIDPIVISNFVLALETVDELSASSEKNISEHCLIENNRPLTNEDDPITITSLPSDNSNTIDGKNDKVQSSRTVHSYINRKSNFSAETITKVKHLLRVKRTSVTKSTVRCLIPSYKIVLSGDNYNCNNFSFKFDQFLCPIISNEYFAINGDNRLHLAQSGTRITFKPNYQFSAGYITSNENNIVPSNNENILAVTSSSYSNTVTHMLRPIDTLAAIQKRDLHMLQHNLDILFTILYILKQYGKLSTQYIIEKDRPPREKPPWFIMIISATTAVIIKLFSEYSNFGGT